MTTWAQSTIQINTGGRGFTDITAEVNSVIAQSGLQVGLCHCFIQHTSASLLINENYDPSVRDDLEMFLASLVVDGDKRFTHRLEGPDDMAAHIRTVLTHTDLSIPFGGGQLQLGTWQGVYLWEHRTQAHQRKVMITLSGK